MLFATSQDTVQLKTRGFKSALDDEAKDIARHVIGCHSTQGTRFQRVFDDRAWRILLATS
jgi:hypothetical protein